MATSMDGNQAFGDEHFDNAAADFSRLLHLITPVTTAILGHLPRLESGALVVDLACGTGEPGLTLAREHPEIQILGIDSSPNMVASAQDAAGREGLPNARFDVASIDDTGAADASVDAVISRFGALQFGDTQTTARELARVLAARSPFSIAVWEDTASNTLFWLAAQAVGRYVDDVLLLVGQLDRLADAGQRGQWLREAGLQQVHSELFHWDYHFASADAAWSMVISKAMFGSLVEPLNADQLADIRQALADSMQPFRTSAGYVIPQTCRLIWGTK